MSNNTLDVRAELLREFTLNTTLIFNDHFCGSKTLGSDADNGDGHIHFLKSGILTVKSSEGHSLVLDEPAVILIPSSSKHYILSNPLEQVDVVCASIKFDQATQNQLLKTLPKFMSFKMCDGQLLQIAQWLFAEAATNSFAQQSITNKLCDIFVLQALRGLVNKGVIMQGVLAGMAHPQLAKVLSALQQNPQKSWTVESMADVAAMSRAKFAALFRTSVGQAPLDFLTDLRVSLAQELLKKSTPVSLVANQVGYDHGSALARVFKKKTGLAPKQWLQSL